MSGTELDNVSKVNISLVVMLAKGYVEIMLLVDEVSSAVERLLGIRLFVGRLVALVALDSILVKELLDENLLNSVVLEGSVDRVALEVNDSITVEKSTVVETVLLDVVPDERVLLAVVSEIYGMLSEEMDEDVVSAIVSVDMLLDVKPGSTVLEGLRSVMV